MGVVMSDGWRADGAAETLWTYRINLGMSFGLKRRVEIISVVALL